MSFSSVHLYMCLFFVCCNKCSVVPGLILPCVGVSQVTFFSAVVQEACAAHHPPLSPLLWKFRVCGWAAAQVCSFWDENRRPGGFPPSSRRLGHHDNDTWCRSRPKRAALQESPDCAIHQRNNWDLEEKKNRQRRGTLTELSFFFFFKIYPKPFHPAYHLCIQDSIFHVGTQDWHMVEGHNLQPDTEQCRHCHRCTAHTPMAGRHSVTRNSLLSWCTSVIQVKKIKKTKKIRRTRSSAPLVFFCM